MRMQRRFKSCCEKIYFQADTISQFDGAHWKILQEYLYYNYQKYPLSPLKPRSMALIEQYLPNISDPVYSVHQSLMWFLWLNWRKSTFYPVTAPNDSKCWPIVMSSIQEPVASNCDVTMPDCYRVVAMDAFLAQWSWGQWFYFVTPVFQHGAPLILHKKAYN